MFTIPQSCSDRVFLPVFRFSEMEALGYKNRIPLRRSAYHYDFCLDNGRFSFNFKLFWTNLEPSKTSETSLPVGPPQVFLFLFLTINLISTSAVSPAEIRPVEKLGELMRRGEQLSGWRFSTQNSKVCTEAVIRRCSWKFSKFHRKAAALETFFNLLMQRVSYLVLEILKIKFSERHISWEKQVINTSVEEFPLNKHHDLDLSYLSHRKHRKPIENCDIKLFITKSDNW